MTFRYSDKYNDSTHFFRTTSSSSLNIKSYLSLKKSYRFLSEIEWRALGIMMSKGWIHINTSIIDKECILLFKKPLTTQEIDFYTIEQPWLFKNSSSDSKEVF